MKISRFETADNEKHVGLIIDGDSVLDLGHSGIESLTGLLESRLLGTRLENLSKQPLPRYALACVRLLAPVERQEVWAVGVTYVRSKKARMEESEFSATAYDKVYEAARPELFFKSLPEKVVGPDEPVGIRSDAKWNVPEPELALVINSRRELAGFTIGNDMSSRTLKVRTCSTCPRRKFIRVLAPSVRSSRWALPKQKHGRGKSG